MGEADDPLVFPSRVLAAWLGKVAVVVTVNVGIVTGPVKVALASFAYNANWVFNSPAVSSCPGVNCAFAPVAHSKPRKRRSFFILVCSNQGRNQCPIGRQGHQDAGGL